MSLRPEVIGPVPEETARVARAAFPRGTRYLRLRDELGVIYDDAQFAPLFPERGRPAEAPWRLALVSVLQFAEELSDRQAAEAVRGRIDWKYLLGLELTDPGFDASVLCEFRARLVAGAAGAVLLDALLGRCRERGWLRARGRQRSDSTHVLAAIRAINRLECVQETLRHALNVLAVAAPEWLAAVMPAEWPERYARRAADDRLPGKQAERDARAAVVGADGWALLDALDADDAPPGLADLPAIRLLRRVWVQNYLPVEHGVRWRTTADGIPPAARFISSPHDPEAHYARKRTTSWVGYKVHLTETCEPETPNLITDVETDAAPAADGAATPAIHEALRARDLLPGRHLVDTGYVDAELLVASRRDYGVDLVGPPRPDVKAQARAGEGFAAEHFAIDWERQRATCPEGRTSVSWTPAVDNRTNPVIKLKFSLLECRACPSRTKCVSPRAKLPRRSLTIRPEEQYHALRAAREREASAQFAAEYAARAGVEGTISQGVRAFGLRRSRYVGLAKTHLGHLLTVVAINLARLSDWLAGIPRATTRRSPLRALLLQPLPA